MNERNHKPHLFPALFFGMLCLIPVALGAAGNTASSLSDDKLVEIKFDQKLNNQVSTDLSFRNENGETVRLGDYFGKRPVILVLGYYECPMLCSLVLNGLVESLQDLTLDAGDQFEVIDVSIDPNETPDLAAAKKRTYLKRYGRHGAADGWHFLTGDEPAIKQLTEEVGFRYSYDPSIDQYAHPSGLTILTPEGKVAHYLFGVTYSAKELDADLKDARSSKVGSPIQQLILLCFHYSPLTGKYGNLIMTIVRASGVVTLLSLAGVMALVTQRRRRKSRETMSASEPAVASRVKDRPSTPEEKNR